MEPMEPRDTNQPNGQGNSDHGSSEALQHHIRTPLPVIYGHVQLLQRRVRRGEVPDQKDLLRTLGYIEQAAHAIEAQLRSPSEKADPPARNADADDE